MAYTISVINGPIIAPGESLSEVVDLSGGEVVRVTMPANWPARSVLTFQISTDGLFFNDLYDGDGHAINVYAIPGAAVVVPEQFRYVNFVKIRSGTPDNPIPVTEQMEFACSLMVAGP